LLPNEDGNRAVQLLLQGRELEAAEELLRGYSQQQAVLPVEVLPQYASGAAAAASSGRKSTGGMSNEAVVAAAGRVLGVLPDLSVGQLIAALEAAATAGDMPAAAVLDKLVGHVLAEAAGSSSQPVTSMSAEQLQSLVAYRCRQEATAADVASAGRLLRSWEAARKKQVPDLTLTTYFAAAAALVVEPGALDAQEAPIKWLKSASEERLLALLRLLLQQQAVAGAASILKQLVSRQNSSEQLISVQQQLRQVMPQIEDLVKSSSTSSTAAAAASGVLSWCLQLGLHVPTEFVVDHLNQALSHHSHGAMPASAAAALSFLQLSGAGAAGSMSAEAAAAESAAVTHHLSRLVTHLVDQDPEWLTGWEQQLQPPAAAAALFSCWAWCSVAPPQLLQLYNGMRQVPGSKELLLPQRVCEVALAAAGQARDWDAGAWVCHTDVKAAGRKTLHQIALAGLAIPFST
jgi:hypothetical protein